MQRDKRLHPEFAGLPEPLHPYGYLCGGIDHHDVGVVERGDIAEIFLAAVEAVAVEIGEIFEIFVCVFGHFRPA